MCGLRDAARLSLLLCRALVGSARSDVGPLCPALIPDPCIAPAFCRHDVRAHFADPDLELVRRCRAGEFPPHSIPSLFILHARPRGARGHLSVLESNRQTSSSIHFRSPAFRGLLSGRSAAWHSAGVRSTCPQTRMSLLSHRSAPQSGTKCSTPNKATFGTYYGAEHQVRADGCAVCARMFSHVRNVTGSFVLFPDFAWFAGRLRRWRRRLRRRQGQRPVSSLDLYCSVRARCLSSSLPTFAFFDRAIKKIFLKHLVGAQAGRRVAATGNPGDWRLLPEGWRLPALASRWPVHGGACKC